VAKVPESPGHPSWESKWVLALGAMIAGFFALSLYAGATGYVNFQLANATDAGIFTQAVWSTAHGGVPPFFETSDCLFKGRCSFLLVHPAFLLYAVVPTFWVAPSVVTLFAVRAAVVALAAVPLFWLTRQLTGSDRWALLSAAMYLLWAPTSTDDFSFHMETFLPLEILLLVALWQAGRYRWGLVAALAAFLTIEIAPVFTFLVGAFFLIPPVERMLRATRARWGARATESFSIRAELGRWWRSFRESLRHPPVRYTVLLMGISVTAFVLLYSFLNVWGARVLGVPSPATGTGLSGLFYNNSTTPPAPISAIFTSSQTIASAEYWLFLYALLAFIPFLSLRSFVLSVPWIGWTFLSDSSRFTSLGHQYSFIAAGPLFVGFAYGLEVLVKRPVAVPGPRPAAGNARRPWSLPGSTRRRAAVGAGLAVAIGVNVLFLPFNPLLPSLGYSPGGPVETGYFDHTLTVIPGFAETQAMIGLVPPNATLATPSALYALAATHSNLLILGGREVASTSLLPFNYTGWPDYALFYSTIEPSLDDKVWGNYSNGSMYGMRAYVASTGIGSVFLYEERFSQPAVAFGGALSPSAVNWTPKRGLSTGPIGFERENASSPTGSVIETNLSVHRAGLAWTGSLPVLAPGSYTFNVTLAVTGLNGTVAPEKLVFGVVAGGFGRTLFDQNLTLEELRGSPWVHVTWNSTLLSPLPGFEVQGFLRIADCSVAVAQVEAQVVGSA